MNSTPWRQRLTYLAMSLVVGWHSLAMIVSPAPNGSAIVYSLRLLFHPYLALFRLETPWNFFAPVGKHAEFRYVVEDAAGNQYTFVPSEEASRSLAGYVWWREFKYLNDGIMASPDFRGDAAGARLCQRHASLKPVSVTLLRSRNRTTDRRMSCAASTLWIPNSSPLSLSSALNARTVLRPLACLIAQ